jgi:formylglycine-generating enzyme required for sulfatase activity
VRLLLAAVCLAASCDPKRAPPLGEVLLVVDTDSSVPKFVSRLRVDVYTETGEWFVSRDVAAFKSSDWPVSFGVHLLDNTKTERRVLVRLRAYPEGKLRDYRGERFVPRPTDRMSDAVTPVPAGGPFDPPRLRIDNSDATPAFEPAPNLAIDRLVWVRIAPDASVVASVLLKTICTGTMADLAGRRSCIDVENAIAPAIELAPGADPKASTISGSFENGVPKDCTAKLLDGEACIPGGMFVFGSAENWLGQAQDDLPERVVVVPPFVLDKTEITVGRFRAAIASGFTGGRPVANEGPFGSQSTPLDSPALCTYSDTDQMRDAYPVNCITADVARAFCVWAGGDLPHEVEWEWAATAAGRPEKGPYPWDGDELACTDAVFARAGGNNLDSVCRAQTSFGPLAETAPLRDVTPSMVVHMLGNVSEWVLESLAALDSSCWLASSMIRPTCEWSAGPHTVRGGGWNLARRQTTPASRLVLGFPGYWPGTGFRCARPVQ